MTRLPSLRGEYTEIGPYPIYHYQAGKGPPLVFIHGHRSDVLRFKTIVQFLAGRFRVYAPDLPGFGKSPPLRHRHRLKEYGEFVRQYIKELNLRDFYLVGGSMGGIIAIYALAPNDLSVKKVVLLATPSSHRVFRMSPKKLKALKIVFSLLYYSKIGSWLMQKCVDNDRLMVWLMRHQLNPKYHHPKIFTHEIHQWRVMPIRIWLETILDILNLDLLREGIKIQAPAIAISTSHDNYFDNARNLEGLQQIFPHLTPLEIEADGHVPPGPISLQQVRALGKPLLKYLNN